MSPISAQITIIDSAQLPEDLEFDKTSSYGILNIKCPENKKDQLNNYHFHFTVDRSGSMDGKNPSEKISKIQQVIAVLINIVNWMLENKHNYKISIHIFDYEVSTLVDSMEINSINKETIISFIKSIKSRGTTNIEEAFNYVYNKLAEHQLVNEKCVHIFMTDGMPTEGERNYSKLVKMIKNKNINSLCQEYYIGFGEDHNATFMENLAKNYNDTYHFIDCFETCGMVYGEIMYNIVFKFKDQLTITLKNGTIYDYKKNDWVGEIQLTNLTYDTEKLFSIKSLYPYESPIVEMNAEYKQEDIIQSSQDQLVINYLWRVKTLDTMYKFKHNDINESVVSETLEKLKKYQHTSHQDANAFLKVLCDDLYITKKIKDNKMKQVYITNRSTSQGDQKGYTTKNVSHLMNDYDNISPEHQLSQDSQTPYLCKNKAKISRSISSQPVNLPRPKLYTPNSDPNRTSVFKFEDENIALPPARASFRMNMRSLTIGDAPAPASLPHPSSIPPEKLTMQMPDINKVKQTSTKTRPKLTIITDGI